MKSYYYLIFILTFLNPIFNLEFCPLKEEVPSEEIKIDNTFTIKPKFENKTVTPLNIKNRIFIKESPKMTSTVHSYYSSSQYCPTDFIIPSKEFFDSLLSDLGNDAYSILTDKNGLNMSESLYYLTSNKTQTSSFTFYFVYFENGKVKIEDKDATAIGYGTKISIKCALSPPGVKLIMPNSDGDIKLKTETNIKTDGAYFNGYLWKIENKIYKSKTVKHSFSHSGRYKIQFWGHLMTGNIVYLCDTVYVKKKEVKSSQSFSEKVIKSIGTNFTMKYSTSLHFAYSNAPVAPRANGGYYIAFTDNFNFLHILSFDKNDKLIKDFNTTDLAFPQDIAETDYGFVYYAKEAGSSYHSYLKLYNRQFDLVNTVEIMNNKAGDDKSVDSNLEKQIIKYGSNGSPVFGMRFMYRPDNGKILYSSGIIFLIFCHYNYFLDSGDHTGDTVVTFNDFLRDMNFGQTWGASHSLIQSVTSTDNFFFSAALGDAYPKGINVEYTSKKEFTKEYDPINQKYNSRLSAENETLAGKITGYENGSADGKLGGLIYFEKLKLFCLVYAKTPCPSDDKNKGKNVIFATTFTFSDKKYKNVKTYEIKVVNEDNKIVQVRAGKLGDDKLVITYYGGSKAVSISKGTVPKVYVYELPKFSRKINDKEYKLLMNTNEDLRTFYDGVLIWATSDKEGKLVINKIGQTRLDDSYDGRKTIITSEDVKKYDMGNFTFLEEFQEFEEKSIGSKVGIVLGIILLIIILAVGAFLLWKYLKFKKAGKEFNFTNLKGELLSK